MDMPSRSSRVVLGYCCGLILLSAATSSSYARSPQTSTQKPAPTASAQPASTPSAANNKLDQPQGNVPPSAPETAVSTPPRPPQDAHQAQLEADSAALLQLAQQLKAEVDKTNKDTLSVTVIRKAAEIEKMARDLKEQMRSK